MVFAAVVVVAVSVVIVAVVGAVMGLLGDSRVVVVVEVGKCRMGRAESLVVEGAENSTAGLAGVEHRSSVSALVKPSLEGSSFHTPRLVLPVGFASTGFATGLAYSLRNLVAVR